MIDEHAITIFVLATTKIVEVEFLLLRVIQLGTRF